MKRLFDLVAAGGGLIVLSPVLAICAAAVWLSSGRPVLVRLDRVGRDFTPFEILKFRTMVSRPGPMITVGADTRITPVGRWLRRTKLDELPQLWNVVRGEMSLVGPRPESPQYVERFRADYEVVLTVRPGITDEASLRYRHEADILAAADDAEALYVDEVLPDKLRLARDYVDHRSLVGDLGILMRTVTARS
jgi:lipopolysaccharide/colanic/teichoic acid biosynthesis glycosyltransferase